MPKKDAKDQNQEEVVSQSLYADNVITEVIDEKSVNLSLAWTLKPKFEPGDVVAAAEEGKKVIFFNRDKEEICEVEKIEEKGKFRFKDKLNPDDKVYFGSETAVANFSISRLYSER